VSSPSEVREAVRPLLFGWHHEGIRRTGEVYPLGAFLLVARTVDVLAGLAYNPPSDDDRGRGARYRRFVQQFFPPQYTKLRKRLWEGLRSSPVHYFATTGVLFADGQSQHQLHLTQDVHGRVILHWPEFFRDYESARDKYWALLESEPSLVSNARRRLERRPLMTVEIVQRPLGLPSVLPTSFPSAASVMANPVASGSVLKVQRTP
jgi:hypothetical protein